MFRVKEKVNVRYLGGLFNRHQEITLQDLNVNIKESSFIPPLSPSPSNEESKDIDSPVSSNNKAHVISSPPSAPNSSMEAFNASDISTPFFS